jgi:hypothetical protein
MPTFLRSPKSNHVRNKLSADSPDKSLGVTLSLSQTSNRDEVSWSSSEGSTYYSGDEASLRERKHTQPVSHPKQEDNAVSAYAISNEFKTNNQLPKDRQEKSAARGPSVKAPKKKKALLKNIESFPAIDIATDNEDVSAVGFLTTEDTAEVFCTYDIPFEITATKKLYENISAVSSTSTVESSVDSSDSESDEGSRKYQEKHLRWTASDTERATISSQTSCVESDETPINEHSVGVVSVFCQDPVSSIESASTWDELSSNGDTSGDESGTGYKPRLQKTWKAQVDAREKVTPLQIDSKVNRIKEIKRKKSDLRTDERIRQLKAKIKSMQGLSSTNVTVSSSEFDSNISSQKRSHQIKVQKIVEHEDETNTNEPLMKRQGSRESRQRNKPIRTKDVNRRNADKSLVGTMIPVAERDAVSDLRLDSSARGFGELGDIEAGRFKTGKEFDKTNSISDRTKVLLGHCKTKALAVYAHVLPIIERQRADFRRKPKYERILIIGIGALFSLFLILLCVMISG